MENSHYPHQYHPRAQYLESGVNEPYQVQMAQRSITVESNENNFQANQLQMSEEEVQRVPAETSSTANSSQFNQFQNIPTTVQTQENFDHLERIGENFQVGYFQWIEEDLENLEESFGEFSEDEEEDEIPQDLMANMMIFIELPRREVGEENQDQELFEFDSDGSEIGQR